MKGPASRMPIGAMAALRPMAQAGQPSRSISSGNQLQRQADGNVARRHRRDGGDEIPGALLMLASADDMGSCNVVELTFNSL